MVYAMNVGLKVEDYARWKAEFDGEYACGARKAGGEKSYRIFRTIEDPNTLVLFFEWDSLDNLQEYAQSEILKELLQRSGVIESGDSYALEELDKGTL